MNRTISQDVYFLLNKVHPSIFKVLQLTGFVMIVQSYYCIREKRESILIFKVLPEKLNHKFLPNLPWVDTKSSSLSPDVNLYTEIK